jgi:hypothetical protein
MRIAFQTEQATCNLEERLREEHGYTGGYTIVKDYVRQSMVIGFRGLLFGEPIAQSAMVTNER